MFPVTEWPVTECLLYYHKFSEKPKRQPITGQLRQFYYYYKTFSFSFNIKPETSVVTDNYFTPQKTKVHQISPKIEICITVNVLAQKYKLSSLFRKLSTRNLWVF